MSFNDCQKKRNNFGLASSGADPRLSPAMGGYGVPGGGGAGCPVQPTPLPTSTPDAAPEVQTLGGAFTFSGYGQFIPLVYGSFVVTGNVFWQGNWREHEFTRDGGPVKIFVTDFALGLCEGEINDVLRIWVGDILVYDKRITVDGSNIPVADANGVLARNTFNYGVSQVRTLNLPGVNNLPELYSAQMGVQTRFVVYNGSEYQMPPDKMVAVQEKENVPGYRGTAFILFENFFTGEDSAPVIRVEVLANAGTQFARKNLTVPNNGFFTSVGDDLAYDATLDVLWVEARAASTALDGQFSVRGSDLTFINDHQWYATATESLTGPSLGSFFEPILDGNVVISVFEGNDGRIVSGSPWAQTALGNLHAASSIPVVHQTTGPADIGIGSIAFNFLDDNDEVVTICALTSSAGGTNCLGFATIKASGEITWHDYVNSTLAQGDGSLSNNTDARLVPLIVSADTAASYDTFPDDVRTEGGHIYAFTIVGGGGYVSDVMHIDRVTFADPPPTTQAEADDTNRATLENIRHAYVGAVSLDLIGGQGRSHTIINCFLDPVDQCAVLTIHIPMDGGEQTDRILKYNPFTNEIVYNKVLPAGLPPTTCRGGFKGVIGTDRQLAYASPENKIVIVDLLYGDARVAVEDTVADGIGDLSAFSSLAQSVWLGNEGALIIRVNGTFGQTNLTKVWLTRAVSDTVSLGAIINDLLLRSGWDPSSIQIDTSVDTIDVRGYAILAEKDVRTAISELKQVFGFDVVESNGNIQYLPRGTASSVTIPYDHLKQSDDGPLTEVIDTDIARLRKVSLKYFDVDRDYQENVQVAVLPEVNIAEFSAESYIDVTVPIALNAAEAKVLAEGLAYQKSVYEANYTFALPPKYQTIDPGDVITLNDNGTNLVMRVRDTEIGADHEVRVNAVTEDDDIYNDTVDLFEAVGDFNDQLIPALPPAVLFEALDIPCPSYIHAERLETTRDGQGILWFFDYNPTGAALTFEHNWQVLIDGASKGLTSKQLSRPTWGYVTTPLATTGPLFSTDTRSSMTVRIVEEGDLTLSSLASAQAMIDNPSFNLAVVGNEIIQFANVVDNGNGSYTFNTFLRARLGTDNAARAQAMGKKFVLVTDATGQFGLDGTRGQTLRLAGYPTTKRVEDLELRLIASPKRNPYQQTYFIDYESRLYKPWPPTSFTAVNSGSDLILTWQKRERQSDSWADDGSAAVPNKDLSTASGWEIYLTTTPTSGEDAPTTFIRYVNVANLNTWTYTAAMQTADGVDISTATLYAYVRYSGGKTGREVGLPGHFTIFPVQ